DGAFRAFQKQVFEDYFARAKPATRLDPAALAAAGISFARSGDLAAAERAAEALFRQAPDTAQLTALWDVIANAFAQAKGDADRLAKAKRYRALAAARVRVKAPG